MHDPDQVTPVSPVRSMNFMECDQMMELVRGGQGEFFQTGPGECRGSMRQINLEGLQMLYADISNTVVVHAAADPDLVVLHVLLEWTGELRWNGRQIRNPTAIVWGSNPEWSRVGSDTVIATLGFKREALFSRLATWTGQDPGDHWQFNGQVLEQTATSRHLLESVREVASLSAESPERFESLDVRNSVLDTMLSSVLQATSARDGSRSRLENVPLRTRTRAVLKTSDFLRQHEHLNVSLLDLCAVAGVSARTLDYAFKENLGMGPMRYLRIRRLQRARKLLRGGPSGKIRVSECAFAAGFTHLGRFSHEYKQLFGESPSETVACSD